MNAVANTKFTASFPVFSPGMRGKYIKNVTVSGIITIDTCYQSNNNKHWIYFTCTASDDPNYYEAGKQYKKQGKNFYPAIQEYEYAETYEQIAEIKHLTKISKGVCYV
jgi:hypothetical protein